MPLAGSLPDLDADGSRCSTRPARLVRWQGLSPRLHLFERLLLGGKEQVVDIDETVLVATGSGWSLVYTLNNRGDTTKLCGRPFRWLRHLLCLQFSSTLNRRFDSIVLINFVSGTSSVSITLQV